MSTTNTSTDVECDTMELAFEGKWMPSGQTIDEGRFYTRPEPNLTVLSTERLKSEVFDFLLKEAKENVRHSKLCQLLISLRNQPYQIISKLDNYQ